MKPPTAVMAFAALVIWVREGEGRLITIDVRACGAERLGDVQLWLRR